MDVLLIIQQELNVPKGRFNSFGKYKYRSCEDILVAVKPLLGKTNSTLNLSDEMVAVGNRIYVKATATLLTEDGKTYRASAYAREDETKKGMDGAQITGSASSYARKYALNGLFSIDDTKDTDEAGAREDSKAVNSTTGKVEQAAFTDTQLKQAVAEMKAVTDEQGFQRVWSKWANNYPALCVVGTDFYKTARDKINSIKNNSANDNVQAIPCNL